jgi:hypothetical protein
MPIPKVVAIVSLLIAGAPAARGDEGASLASLAPLIGSWDAHGGGAPGQGASGTVEFVQEVEGHAVIRRNSVTYPAAEGRPAATHQDLLVLYAEGADIKGLYVDGEGHVIQYAAEHPSPGKVVLVSEAGPGPRFRLTHDWSKPGTLQIVFEIAPPGSKQFKTYAEGRATRRRAPER